MQPVLNVEDVKQVESDLTGVGVSISELMHRAGVSTAREVMGMGNVEKVVVMCGLDNNEDNSWVYLRRSPKYGTTSHPFTGLLICSSVDRKSVV